MAYFVTVTHRDYTRSLLVFPYGYGRQESRPFFWLHEMDEKDRQGWLRAAKQAAGLLRRYGSKGSRQPVRGSRYSHKES